MKTLQDNDAVQQQKHRIYGDWINYIAIVCNIALTSAAMIGYPTYDTYDDWWRRRGFCVDFTNENNENRNVLLDTEVICAIALTTSAIVLYIFCYLQKVETPVIVKAKEGIFNNLAHGLGHLHLYLAASPPPDIKFTMTFDGIGWVITLMFFWTAALRNVVSVSTQKAALAGVAVIALQTLLKVPPDMSFSYSQSIIFISGAMRQLSLPAIEKDLKYVIASASFLPLYPLYVIESTQCSKFYAHQYGGHTIYDTYLAILPFAVYYLNSSIDEKKQKKL